jgi:hypothetical protein
VGGGRAGEEPEGVFITTTWQSGHLVRGRDFDSASLATTPLADYPATKTPYESWYQTIVTDAGPRGGL